MIKGKDLEELKVPKVAEIRAKLYEALGKSYAAGKKDSVQHLTSCLNYR